MVLKEGRLGIVAAILASIVVLICWAGLFMVHPNEAKVLQLFGKYAGTTVKVEGEELLVMREDDIVAVVEG